MWWSCFEGECSVVVCYVFVGMRGMSGWWFCFEGVVGLSLVW